MSMEIDVAGVNSVEGVLLQWGHASMSMEILRQAAEERLARQASMGPCFYEHGNVSCAA